MRKVKVTVCDWRKLEKQTSAQKGKDVHGTKDRTPGTQVPGPWPKEGTAARKTCLPLPPGLLLLPEAPLDHLPLRFVWDRRVRRTFFPKTSARHGRILRFLFRVLDGWSVTCARSVRPPLQLSPLPRALRAADSAPRLPAA